MSRPSSKRFQLRSYPEEAFDFKLQEFVEQRPKTSQPFVTPTFPRKQGTFGMTNRSEFLKSRQSQKSSRPLALGLTEAGCASSTKRSMDVPTAFGTLSPRQNPIQTMPITPIEFKNKYPEKSIYDILLLQKQIVPCINDRLLIRKEGSKPATRYSANTGWMRDTRPLTEGDPSKHHYVNEKVV